MFKYTATLTTMMQPTTRQMVKGLDNLSKTILNKARINAPVLTGALRASGNISNTGMYSRVIGFSVPYATVREFNNNKHPNTKFYLRRATVSTLQNASSFFKEN